MAPAPSPEIVLALYRPRPGRDRDLESLLRRHVPTLVSFGLATSRPPALLRASDGTYVEMFEWASGAESARRAHELPAVAEIWGAMERVADFVTLGDLEESKRRFPHFRPVAL